MLEIGSDALAVPRGLEGFGIGKRLSEAVAQAARQGRTGLATLRGGPHHALPIRGAGLVAVVICKRLVSRYLRVRTSRVARLLWSWKVGSFTEVKPPVCSRIGG